jgi:hypothetical protein
MIFTGRAFLRGIECLDGTTRDRFARHGARLDGRWSFVERIVEEAMARMAGKPGEGDGE